MVVVELVLPYVSCRPSLVSTPSKGWRVHSRVPQLLTTISVACPGDDLGKLLVEVPCEGPMLLLHFGQLQSSTAVWGSGRGGFSKDAAAGFA